MGVRIFFSDPNVTEEGGRVYRSTSPMDPNNLPAPFDSLPPDSTSYDDGTVLPGQTYYYRVSAFTGGGTVELVSNELAVTASPNTFEFSDLFLNAENGGAYDVSRVDTLFQDAAGTIPVTADGQPVGRMNDISGNGNDVYASSDALRPTYKTDGVHHWLEGYGSSSPRQLKCLMNAEMDAREALSILTVEQFDRLDYPTNIVFGGSGVTGSSSTQAYLNFGIGTVSPTNGYSLRITPRYHTQSDVSRPTVLGQSYYALAVADALAVDPGAVIYDGTDHSEYAWPPTAPNLNLSKYRVDHITVLAFATTSSNIVDTAYGRFYGGFLINRKLDPSEVLQVRQKAAALYS